MLALEGIRITSRCGGGDGVGGGVILNGGGCFCSQTEEDVDV